MQTHIQMSVDESAQIIIFGDAPLQTQERTIPNHQYAGVVNVQLRPTQSSGGGRTIYPRIIINCRFHIECIIIFIWRTKLRACGGFVWLVEK